LTITSHRRHLLTRFFSAEIFLATGLAGGGRELVEWVAEYDESQGEAVPDAGFGAKYPHDGEWEGAEGGEELG
jgi:hypothetical protein